MKYLFYFVSESTWENEYKKNINDHKFWKKRYHAYLERFVGRINLEMSVGCK